MRREVAALPRVVQRGNPRRTDGWVATGQRPDHLYGTFPRRAIPQHKESHDQCNKPRLIDIIDQALVLVDDVEQQEEEAGISWPPE